MTASSRSLAPRAAGADRRPAGSGDAGMEGAGGLGGDGVAAALRAPRPLRLSPSATRGCHHRTLAPHVSLVLRSSGRSRLPQAQRSERGARSTTRDTVPRGPEQVRRARLGPSAGVWGVQPRLGALAEPKHSCSTESANRSLWPPALGHQARRHHQGPTSLALQSRPPPFPGYLRLEVVSTLPPSLSDLRQGLEL